MVDSRGLSRDGFPGDDVVRELRYLISEQRGCSRPASLHFRLRPRVRMFDAVNPGSKDRALHRQANRMRVGYRLPQFGGRRGDGPAALL